MQSSDRPFIGDRGARSARGTQRRRDRIWLVWLPLASVSHQSAMGVCAVGLQMAPICLMPQPWIDARRSRRQAWRRGQRNTSRFDRHLGPCMAAAQTRRVRTRATIHTIKHLDCRQQSGIADGRPVQRPLDPVLTLNQTQVNRGPPIRHNGTARVSARVRSRPAAMLLIVASPGR